MDKYYIWVIMALGEGEPEISRLLKQFGSPENVYDAFIGNMALVGAELTSRAAKMKLETAETMLESIIADGYGIVTIDSPEYPEHLKKTANPPCVLFTYGDKSLLQKKLVTVVGSRAVTDHTVSIIPNIISGISDEFAVVGTLSEGCDQLTCMNAVKHGVGFIEVLPCGFSCVYPAGSRTLRRFLYENGGLCITEFLPKERAGHGNFLKRSRILGGISYVTLVLQAGAKSGALATAEYSLAPIFVPPNNIFTPAYSGAVGAVRAGARLYMSPGDIDKAYERGVRIENDPEYDPAKKRSYRKKTQTGKPSEKQTDVTDTQEIQPEVPADTAEKTFESEEHAAVFGTMQGQGKAVGAEELIALTGIDAARLSEILLDLEIEGLISASAGRYAVREVRSEK